MARGMKIRKIAAVAVLVLGSLAADNVAPSKAELEAMYDKAFRAFGIFFQFHGYARPRALLLIAAEIVGRPKLPVFVAGGAPCWSGAGGVAFCGRVLRALSSVKNLVA